MEKHREYITASFLIRGYTYKVCVGSVEYDEDLNMEVKYCNANDIQSNIKAQVAHMEEYLNRPNRAVLPSDKEKFQYEKDASEH